MKRLVKIMILCLTFILFIATPAYGTDVDDEDINNMLIEAQEELNSDSRMEKFYKYINNLKIEDELLSGLNPKEYIASYLASKEDPISFKTIGNSIISFLFREIKATMSLVVSILVS